jgi:Zn-dependent protease
MSETRIVFAIFEFVVLVFSLSIHEAAHGWMANRLGDPTAKMLGRVTLNPIKHIDPIGTIAIPLVMLLLPGYGQFLIGWAKPTPVTTRNFKNVTRDDILTTVAGPVSNVLAALGATVLLLILSKTSLTGAAIVHQLAGMGGVDPALMGSMLFPLAMILYMGVMLNLILAVFNLLPLPPLDGSHVFRHMLPYKALRVYDSLGIFSLILILFVGARLIGYAVDPAMRFVNGILLSF